MKKQFAVIGLGNFGFYLAASLFQKGHEVLCIDIDTRKVQEIRDHVDRAVIADATDPQALKELDLINKFGIQVVAVKELVPQTVVMIPTGRFLVKDSDVLILLGPDRALAELQEYSKRPRWISRPGVFLCPIIDGVVKSPISALRIILRHCGVP